MPRDGDFQKGDCREGDGREGDFREEDSREREFDYFFNFYTSYKSFKFDIGSLPD